MQRTPNPVFCQTGVRAVLALVLFALGGTAADTAAGQSPLPAFQELAEGWTTLRPGGETMCAHGTEFEFYVRPGDPEHLLVYLYGGGGCWDAEGCQEGSEIYAAEIIPERHPGNLGGVLDLQHPENPFADYSMVAVPVCTGDAHLGANDTVYELPDASAAARSFTIRHRGKTNVLSAIDWIAANFAAPREVFVAGSSAGSLGVPFHGSLIAQRYPDARVAGLGDDSGSYGAEVSAGVDATRWGLPDVLRQHPGWDEFDDGTGIEALNVTAGRSAPNLELYQVDHAHDQAQYFYAERAGMDDPDVFRMLQVNRASIREQLPDFRGYTVGGFRHTALQVPYFYRYAENGHRLRDWVAAIAAGSDVTDISCLDCERASFVYDEMDLQLATRALELLSAPGAWNPNDTVGSCAATPAQYSLRCVVSAAAAEVTGNDPGHHSFSWDVIFAAAERLGGERQSRAVVLYNNHPDTAAADIVSLLEGVRAHIERELGGALRRAGSH